MIILSAIMMFVLSACSTEESRKTESYVSSVKELVNSCVNTTRTLKTQKENFNCQDSVTSKEYISSIDKLADLYGSLLKLEAPNSYDDLNESLLVNSENALSNINELKTLVQYAFANNDDSLYQKNAEKLYNSYQNSYNNLVSVSSEIQTRFRNA